jgi:hypothetical protein
MHRRVETMISHLIFWPAVRCDARLVVDLQWRQRRVSSIVGGALQFVYAAPIQAFQLRFSAMRQDYSGLHFHHRLRYAAATRSLLLVEAVKLLLAYQGS